MPADMIHAEHHVTAHVTTAELLPISLMVDSVFMLSVFFSSECIISSKSGFIFHLEGVRSYATGISNGSELPRIHGNQSINLGSSAKNSQFLKKFRT